MHYPDHFWTLIHHDMSISTSLLESELVVSLPHPPAVAAETDRAPADIVSPPSTNIGLFALPRADGILVLDAANRVRTASTPLVCALPPETVTVAAPGIRRGAPPPPPPPGRTTPIGTAPGTSIRKYPSSVPSRRYKPIWYK